MNIILSNNLNKLQRSSQDNYSIVIDSKSNILELTVFENETLEDLENSLLKQLKIDSFLHILKDKLNIVLISLLTTLVIAGTMFTIQIFLNVSTDLFKELKQPEARYIFFSLIALLLFSKIPNIGFTSENEKVKSWILSFFNNRKKQEKRVNKLLNKLIKQNKIEKLILGNFDINKDNLLGEYIISTDIKDITLVSREVNFESIKKDILSYNLSSEFAINITQNNGEKKLLSFLSENDKKILSLILETSSKNTNEVSLELASLFLSHYDKSIKEAFPNYIEVFHNEYNILDIVNDRVYLKNYIVDDLYEITKKEHQYFESLYKNYILENFQMIYQELNTTYSLFQLYTLTQYNTILKELINKSFEKEDYHIFDNYIIDKIYTIPHGKNIIEKFDNKESIYLSFDINILEKILIILERLGQVKKAKELCIYLQGSQNEFFKVVEARLEHREGDFVKSIDILKEIDTTQLNKEKLMEYYRIYAWIIQDFKEISIKQTGYELLSKLLVLAKEQNDMWFIRSYYNTIGNYFEWEKDFQKAIESYQNALAIPGLGSYSYGALFTNLGITYRYLYKSQENKETPTIENSITYLKKGMYLKEESSAHDEVQISYHNLAISILLKAKYTNNTSLYDEALEYIEKGLEIVRKYDLKLKKDLLLLEKYISLFMQNRDIEDNLLDELRASFRESENLNDLSIEFLGKEIKELLNE